MRACLVQSVITYIHFSMSNQQDIAVFIRCAKCQKGMLVAKSIINQKGEANIFCPICQQTRKQRIILPWHSSN